MTRCTACNGILRKGEKTCFGCGEATVSKSNAKGALRKNIATLLSMVFFASLALTAASFFFADRTPPFIGCLTGSIILLFVKRSADQTSERRA